LHVEVVSVEGVGCFSCVDEVDNLPFIVHVAHNDEVDPFELGGKYQSAPSILVSQVFGTSKGAQRQQPVYSGIVVNNFISYPT
jgi:hypothetical protein